MTRCTAIKRDGLRCNYNIRPDSTYCGVHRLYGSRRVISSRSGMVPTRVNHSVIPPEIRSTIESVNIHSSPQHSSTTSSTSRRRRNPFVEPYIREISDALGISVEHVLSLRGEYVYTKNQIDRDRELTVMIKSFESLEVTEENCLICLSKPENLVVIPCCKKEFCSECLITWARTKRTCPHCREKLRN